MTKEEIKKEKEALRKVICILKEKEFTPTQRFWLRKYKPYIYFLKYGNIESDIKTDKQVTYSLCSQDVKDYINEVGDLYPNYKVRILTDHQLSMNKLLQG